MREVLITMSYPEFQKININRLKHFKQFKSDPNLVKKAILSLREEGLIVSSQGTSESHLEEAITYKLTQKGTRFAAEAKERWLRHVSVSKRIEKNNKIMKEEKDKERNDVIKAVGVIAAIIIIMVISLLIMSLIGGYL